MAVSKIMTGRSPGKSSRRPKAAGSSASAGPSASARIRVFLEKYSPQIAAQLSAARRHLRALFPRGFELVFDNYNALVFGISPTESSRDSFVSVAGYPRWVTLFFLNGAHLEDPNGLLQGTGKQVRSIRLDEAADLKDRHVRKLIAQAVAPHAQALSEAPKLTTVIKTVVAKQRPRRKSQRKA